MVSGRSYVGSRFSRKRGTRTKTIVLLIVIQGFALVFFVGDIVIDFSLREYDGHLILEAFVCAALAIGTALGGIELRRVVQEIKRTNQALASASGAFAQVINDKFFAWNLTPAEKDVAIMALKGFDVSEISEIRGAAQSTIRAQFTKVYAKSGVSNRSEFIALFLDQLIEGPVV